MSRRQVAGTMFVVDGQGLHGAPLECGQRRARPRHEIKNALPRFGCFLMAALASVEDTQARERTPLHFRLTSRDRHFVRAPGAIDVPGTLVDAAKRGLLACLTTCDRALLDKPERVRHYGRR